MTNSNVTETRHLGNALNRAIERAEALQALYDDLGSGETSFSEALRSALDLGVDGLASDETDEQLISSMIGDASNAADDAVEATREALRDSDEEREWQMTEEGYCFATVWAVTAEDAIDLVRDDLDISDYQHDATETTWTTIYARCEATDERGSETIQLDPEEPECSESEHDWQSPIEIVGGIKENPGVWGKGGGVKILEVCMHCGCSRRTDTWAQDHCGRQGLTSVAYEAGEFADEVETMRDEEAT